MSLYSILTIFFVISVTIGVLVLAGWELNIMESVVFSVAAGLSADFTLHYSVAYRTSLIINDRVERTKSSLEHIGAAILMGAFTTFIAGEFKHLHVLYILDIIYIYIILYIILYNIYRERERERVEQLSPIWQGRDQNDSLIFFLS